MKKTEAAPEVVPEVVSVEVPAPEPAPAAPFAPPLAAWLADMEQFRIADGVVLVKATHPEATASLWTGRYSGVQIAPGPLSAVWSDGSTLTTI